MRPYCSSAACAIPFVDSSSVTSVRTQIASPPSSLIALTVPVPSAMSATTTRAPSRAKCSECDFPR